MLKNKKFNFKEFLAENAVPVVFLTISAIFVYYSGTQPAIIMNDVVSRFARNAFFVISLLIPVLAGMGLVVLHSGHHSKIFRALMGTTCNLRWRDGDRERIWTINPAHPIAKGIPAHFSIDVEEMYGECFDIPEPDELVFLGWFAGGEVFRSGCCWNRGLGKIFYFQPGHESNPTFHNEYVQRIIINAVRWAAPMHSVKEPLPCPEKKISPEERYKERKAL